MVKALESQGVTLSVSSGSPTAFDAIANISKIHGPGENADAIDVSNLSSVAREKLMGVPDEGPVTLDIFYDPDAATHLLLRAAMRNRTRMEFKITLTDAAGTTLSFFGYVIAFVINTALSDAIRGAVTIAVDGESTDGDTPEPPIDPSIYKVLMHFDGTNGATTTTDVYANTVTLAGAAILSTDQTKFGSASLRGAGATPASWAVIAGPTSLGAASWTAECFFYPSAIDGQFSMWLVDAEDSITQNSALALVLQIFGATPTLRLYAVSPTGAIALPVDVSAAGLSANAWHHAAVTFDQTAGHYYTYIDGVKMHDITDSRSIKPIQRIWVIPNEYAGGGIAHYIDEWRLSNVCRYPGGGTFTPPAAPFSS